MNLRDKWNNKLAQKNVAQMCEMVGADADHVAAEQNETEGRVWFAEMVAKIPAAIDTAAAEGKTQIEVGEFRVNDLLLAEKGEYYPTRDEIGGGARLLFDYCQREGLHLFVGGDFRMSGSWRSPFEVIIRPKR